MTTRPTTTPDWQATGNISAPSPARKLAGWLGVTSTTPGDKPPAQEFNWFWNIVSQWISWVSTNGATRITSYEDATGSVTDINSDTPQAADGEVFVLNDFKQPVGGEYPLVNSEVIAGINGVNGIYSDGRILHVAVEDGAGQGEWRRYSLDGSTLWSTPQTFAGSPYYSISSSGRHVALTRTNGASNETRIYRCTTGSEYAAGLMTVGAFTVNDADVIGKGAIMCGDDGTWVVSGDMSVGSTGGNRGGLGVHNLTCCAWGALGFVGGIDTGGANSGEVIVLSSGAVIGTINRNGATVYASATDGDYFYTGGDPDGVSGTHIECRTWGNSQPIIWAATLSTSVRHIAVDDRFLFASTAAGVVYVVDKRQPVTASGGLAHIESINPPSGLTIRDINSDGRYLYVATDGGFDVYELPRRPGCAVRLDPDVGGELPFDNYRRPFHNVILPGELR